MSEPGWWQDFLRDVYVTSRFKPGWNDVYDCHDEEDQEYFLYLEEKRCGGESI